MRTSSMVGMTTIYPQEVLVGAESMQFGEASVSWKGQRMPSKQVILFLSDLHQLHRDSQPCTSHYLISCLWHVTNKCTNTHHYSGYYYWPHNVVKCGICYGNVCPSVCPSNSWVVHKRFKILKYTLHIAPSQAVQQCWPVVTVSQWKSPISPHSLATP